MIRWQLVAESVIAATMIGMGALLWSINDRLTRIEYRLGVEAHYAGDAK